MPRKTRPLSSAHVAGLVAQDREAAKLARAEKAAARKAQAELAKNEAALTRANDAVIANAQAEIRAEQDAANALATAKADAEATGVSLEEMLAEMGVDATGHPLKSVAKTPYQGPMVALKAARAAYVKAANGILCNGSPLAVLCGQFTRPVVVAALVDALKLAGNPYLHLNPGQQSMNLRNKARHAIGNGELSLGEIEAHLKAHASRKA